jgi:hypothetical protein
MNIQESRVNSVLDKKITYPEGVMSRREYLILQKGKGSRVEEKMLRDTAKEQKEREALEILWRRVPLGNPCHPETKVYLSRKAALDTGFFKPEYRLWTSERSFYPITKIEYLYFLSL